LFISSKFDNKYTNIILASAFCCMLH